MGIFASYKPVGGLVLEIERGLGQWLKAKWLNVKSAAGKSLQGTVSRVEVRFFAKTAT